MKNKILARISKGIGIVVIILIMTFSLVSCSFLGNLAGMLLSGATDRLYNFISSYIENTDPDNCIYGSENNLAVGFNNGKMIAFWDDYGDYEYELKVRKSGATNTYNTSDCVIDLKDKGYNYGDNLEFTLNGLNSEEITVPLSNYSYKGISTNEYNKYTANMQGGWTDLDCYIATRYELFEMFNYIILFQPNMEIVSQDGVSYFDSQVHLFLGYDYTGIYPQGTSEKDAFTVEIASAISAFDDSAGYNYSYSLKDNFVECDIYLRFSYDHNPSYTTNTNTIYTQNTHVYNSDKPHYNLATPRARTFKIDAVTKTVEVESSDQLYFALKRGNRPICKIGSNAEYIYGHMRYLLSRLISDNTSDGTKVHYIYDYLVDTVLYDYEFVDTVMKDQNIKDSNKFFLYKCLYMEGVFGFTNSKTFEQTNCVAICDGISKAVLCMCAIEGIPVIKVSGKSGGVAHAWNKVKIDNNWYLVDATWGNVRNLENEIEIMTHDYLLVADDAGHEEDKWIKYPPAPKAYNVLFY